MSQGRKARQIKFVVKFGVICVVLLHSPSGRKEKDIIMKQSLSKHVKLHFRETVQYLQNTFGIENVWSMSNDPDIRFSLEWPANSPDLTPCDYWLFSFLKRK